VQLSSVLGIDVRLVRDGDEPRTAEFLAANASIDERHAAFAGLVDERGEVVLPYNCLLVMTEGEVVLIDTGPGEYSARGGNLERALAAEGLEPGDVTVVVLTHAHPDHVGGLSVGGRPRFAAARHLITLTEWDFWTSALVAGSLPPALAVPIEEQLRPLERRRLLELVAKDVEPIEGVRLVASPGHTPGHVAVEVGAGASRMLFIADAAMHPVHFEHPSWGTEIENDLSVMCATRERLFTAAADERLLVGASHIWLPGRVSHSGSSFRFLPS
jgi:glyoxylase-like metal-dependent hydrolase (beta-lactamase superfamily II)